MAQIQAGRYTARVEGDFVVFIIGFRINSWWAVHKWLPVAMAMGPMLRSLYTHPSKGFLGAQQYFYGRGAMLVQYWRGFEDLERFARDSADAHLPAWRRFNKAIGSDGTVGIFHETYLVPAGHYEAVYGNMPVFGLAAATTHEPAVGAMLTARRRLGGQNEPAVPTPEQSRE